MNTITLIGWKAGLNKIELNNLLREYAHLSLADAKNVVDKLLAGDRPQITIVNDVDVLLAKLDAIAVAWERTS